LSSEEGGWGSERSSRRVSENLLLGRQLGLNGETGRGKTHCAEGSADISEISDKAAAGRIRERETRILIINYIVKINKQNKDSGEENSSIRSVRK
jgi:hypothetical protein